MGFAGSGEYFYTFGQCTNFNNFFWVEDFPNLKVAGDPLPLVTGEGAAELVLDLGGREGGAPGGEGRRRAVFRGKREGKRSFLGEREG